MTRNKKRTTSQIRNNSLILQELLGDGIDINVNEVFPMVVMATMSSGKSTLINALLGQEILPSRNEACTSKVYSVLDDDRATETRIYITYNDGKVIEKRTEITEELEKANRDNSVTNIMVRGHVKGILNTDKALLLIDTPGPNNSRDTNHEVTMLEVLERIKGGLLLYVLNATQLGINDDKYLLEKVTEYIKNNKKIKVLFALNKIDQIDEEKEESVQNTVDEVYDYLKKNGIDNPQIIPVSALAASIFKKVMNNEKLTRSEFRLFSEYYELFQPIDLNMRMFARTNDLSDQKRIIDVHGDKISVGELNRAIDNTGIRLLEEEIQKAQILSSEMIKNTIKVSRGGK